MTVSLSPGYNRNNRDNPGQESFTVAGDVTKLLADVDMLLLLTSCRNPGHKFGGDIMNSQFSSQNQLACPITNSDLISNVFNGSTSILTNELLTFGYSVGRCGADGLPCVLIILNACSTGNEPRHSNTLVRLIFLPRTPV
jgi:hypothetical protein